MVNKTPAQIISQRIDDMAAAAMARYQERYDQKAYMAATVSLTITNANLVLDDAMFLCGHPHYTRSNRDWSENVLEFLALFC